MAMAFVGFVLVVALPHGWGVDLLQVHVGLGPGRVQKSVGAATAAATATATVQVDDSVSSIDIDRGEENEESQVRRTSLIGNCVISNSKPSTVLPDECYFGHELSIEVGSSAGGSISAQFYVLVDKSFRAAHRQALYSAIDFLWEGLQIYLNEYKYTPHYGGECSGLRRRRLSLIPRCYRILQFDKCVQRNTFLTDTEKNKYGNENMGDGPFALGRFLAELTSSSRLFYINNYKGTCGARGGNNWAGCANVKAEHYALAVNETSARMWSDELLNVGAPSGTRRFCRNDQSKEINCKVKIAQTIFHELLHVKGLRHPIRDGSMIEAYEACLGNIDFDRTKGTAPTTGDGFFLAGFSPSHPGDGIWSYGVETMPTPMPPTPSPPRPPTLRPPTYKSPTLRPPTTPSTSSNIWEAHDGYACRIEGSDSGEKDKDFEKHTGSYVDFTWCEDKCEGSTKCRGFEYRYSDNEGKCEIWLRYYGNVERKTDPYHWCYWKKGWVSNPIPSGGTPSGGTTTAGNYFSKRDNTACGFGGDAKESDGDLFMDISSDLSLDSCKKKCTSRISNGKSCFGYDFRNKDGRCRVYKREPTDVKSKDGVTCWLHS